MKSARTRTEHGAVAVEFALIFPVLVLILFGMITTGLTYSDHLAVTNAVREGARFGSAVDYTQAGWATSVRDRVKDVYFNAGSTLSDNQICVKVVSSAGVTLASWTGTSCGNEPGSPSGMATGSCVAKVWVRKPAHIELIVASVPAFSIGGSSVAYYGRTVGSCTAS